MRELKGRELFSLTCLTLGLVAIGIWTDVVGYSVNLLADELMSAPEATNRDAFLWGRFFIGIAVLIFARYIPAIQNTLTIVVALLMSISTGILIISYHQTLIDPSLFSALGVFCAGGGYIFLVSVFYILFAERIKTSRVVVCIALSLIFETVISVLISLYLPAVSQAFIVTLAPLVVACLYFAGERLSRSQRPEGQAQKVKGVASTALLVQIVIFTMLLVLIRALSNVGIWGDSRTNFIGMMELSVDELIAISVIILVLSYLVFILPQNRFSLHVRCLFAFVVLLTGLQILAFTNDYQMNKFFDIITTAVELFAHLAYWMMVITCIRETTVPPFRVASIARPFYTLITLAWVHILQQQEFMTSTFVMIIVYILLVAVLIMAFSGKIMENLALRIGSPEEQNRKHKDELENFAQAWRLSQRETEIFVLLMSGKKRHTIEEECGLSEGTVKTHISNIYRKLDVHSKGEMFELFEKARLSLDENFPEETESITKTSGQALDVKVDSWHR